MPLPPLRPPDPLDTGIDEVVTVVTLDDREPLLLAAYPHGYQQCTQHQRPAMDALTEQAFSDPLTGLPNRRSAEQHLAAAVQDGAPLVVGLIDVRGLKRVNDSAGHSTGDELLRGSAPPCAR